MGHAADALPVLIDQAGRAVRARSDVVREAVVSMWAHSDALIVILDYYNYSRTVIVWTYSRRYRHEK